MTGYLGKVSVAKVVGTFGTYFRDRRYPSQEEQDGLKILAQAAVSAIQN